MATLDHIIVKVNNLVASVEFYTGILGFTSEGVDGPFTVLRVGPDCQFQLAPYGTQGSSTMRSRCPPRSSKRSLLASRRPESTSGPRSTLSGANTGPGSEAGARGMAPTLYFHDRNQHLLEIRTYES